MKLRHLLTLLLAVFLFSGCSAPTVLTDYAPAQENRLVIYTSHKEDVYRPIIREFEARTGIWVEIVSGGTSELLARLEQEKASPRADVMFGGGVETLESYRSLFGSVQCDGLDAVAEPLRGEDDVWAPFSALPIVLIYNTKLVDPADLTGWEDLQRPEFQGKIAFADPSKSGSAFTALVTAAYACGESILRPLAQNIHGQLSSSGEVLSCVADGSCLVGVTLEETALQRIAAGDNIAMVYPVEGTSCVPDGTAVINGAPHRDNAVKFLEFTLSAEVQQLLGSHFYRRSVRPDIPSPEALLPMEQIHSLTYNAKWAAEHREEILAWWTERIQEAA